MKNILVAAACLVILGAVFLYGKSCGTPAVPVHAAQVKTVDSATLIARAAVVAEKRVRDSIAPGLKLMQDTIALLKKQKKPADASMDGHILRIGVLVDSIKAAQDSSQQLNGLITTLMNVLADAGIDYQALKAINDKLIQQLSEANNAKDTLLAANERLKASLVATLAVTQDAFHTTVADDKQPATQLKLYKVATKGEAVIIAALALKILLTK